jgi:hypothetical protein
MLLLPILAALAMVAQDILGSVMVMCESAGRKWWAGLMDSGGWLVGIATTTISVTSLQGHDTTQKILVVGFVTIANLLGTAAGVASGSWLLHRKPTLKAVDPLLDLTRRVRVLEQASGHDGYYKHSHKI